MIENILIYIFLAIFVLTAIITLCSLPGWIDIGEWYKKKLFLALILEVVGCIVLMFRNGVINADVEEPCFDEEKYVKVRKDGNLDLKWDKKYSLSAFDLDTTFVGNIVIENLEQMGLINQINNKVDLLNDFALMDYRLVDGKWKNVTSDLTDSPFNFVIYHNGSNYCYKFIKEGNTYKELSFENYDIFDAGKRKMHIIEYIDKDLNKYYYFYRITSADLGENMFVRVAVFRVEGKLTYKNISS